jgi:MFS family permease
VQFIDAYDIAAMGPALPKIQRDLGMSPDALQWVVTAYVLGYGGFLLLGGRLADLFDRKRLLIASVLVFAAASAVGGVAAAGWVLIAARLAKGITAAFTAPASLAILLDTHEEGQARNKALGAYLSIAAVGFTSGLVLGGLLAAVTWRLVLLIPAGLALIAAITAARVIPHGQRRAAQQREPVDMLGALTVTAGLMALVYGVSRASASGWGDSLTIGSLAASCTLLAAFVQAQRVRRVPLVPLRIFTRPGLSRANAAMFLLQGSYVGWQFIAMSYPATNITAVVGARPEEQGLASGLFVASFQVGSGVILGIVASVLAADTHPGLSDYRLAVTATAAAAALAVLTCATGLMTRSRAADTPDPGVPSQQEQQPADKAPSC